MFDKWDVLAFLGAIIGGLHTLYGVRYTINKNERKDILDQFPIKMRKIDGITRKIKDELLYYIENDNHEKIKSCTTHLMDESSKLMQFLIYTS